MTLVPAHRTTPRPDLPQFELGPYCSVPGCTELREEGGGHHIFRRSLGPAYRESWWVQLSDGTLVPNRIGLCFQHHRDVTGNIGGHKAHITLRDGFNLTWETRFTRFETRNDPDSDMDEWQLHGRLNFAHDPYEVLHLTQLTMDGGEVPHETVVAPNGTVPNGIIEATSRVNAKTSIDFVEDVRAVGGHERFENKTQVVTEPTPGQPCSLCHRRVPHPKKPDSPKSKTVAYRVPLDDAETHHEMLDAWAEHWGLLESKHHLYKLVTFAAADALAGPKKKLGKLEDA